MRPRRGLRGRLLAAFVLVAVPPVLVLALAVNALLTRSFEQASRDRLEEALRGARAQIEKRRRQAREAIASAAAELPLLAPDAEGDPGLADPLARGRALDVLEIVDGEERVISSHHWPAGFGLADRDLLFPHAPDFRIEKVAEGHGAAERLAVTASARGEWQGRAVLVRGGWWIDASFAADLSTLTGLNVALFDQAHGRWIASPRSALASWADPPLATARGGDARLPGGAYRWSAAPLVPSLWLVAATPKHGLESVTQGVRRLTFGIASVALLGALLAGIILSRRIARPVSDLSEAARRMEGDAEAAGPAGEDEIGALARTFDSMTAELAASRERVVQAERVAAWREMARRLAHELKNPLFPIQLSIETLRRVQEQELAGEPGAEERFHALFRESSETILDELRSLRKIIDEFSQFARTPRPQLTPIDVNQVVEQALALHRPRAEAVSVEKELAAGLPPVPADRDLLSRALGNLVANALEAMPDGGSLRVRTAADPAGVAIEVEDTGTGLLPDQRTRLFTPYYTTKKGGTGLGLAIVQGIVSDHGGRVQVRSEPGAGTTFTLLLPTGTTT